MHTFRPGFNVKASFAKEGLTPDKVNLTLNSKDWVLTQTTALASVNLFDKFLITPNSSKFVNNNGNSWPTHMLKRNYKTLIGAHNYRNHVQDPTKSFGIIIDAIPRKVSVSDDGKESVLYVDILIATSRHKDPDWAAKIESGLIKYGSVGCSSSTLQCSKCGNLSYSKADFCNHVKFESGLYFINPTDGNRYRVSNMVTDYPNDENETFMTFTEFSYLTNNPAFPGAAISHVINVPPKTDVVFPVDKNIVTREAFGIWKDYFKVN